MVIEEVQAGAAELRGVGLLFGLTPLGFQPGPCSPPGGPAHLLALVGLRRATK